MGGSETATGEIVVHLGLDRMESSVGLGGLVAERENIGGVGLRLSGPIGEGEGLREEQVHLGLGDARLGASVGFGAEASDDVADDGLGGIVPGRVGGNDAVAIELGFGENLHG